MAPKKNRKQAPETRSEEPVKNLVAPPESIGEEEPNSREDQDEPEIGPENEEEQRSSVLFTPEQLEVLLKMNRPDFGGTWECVTCPTNLVNSLYQDQY